MRDVDALTWKLYSKDLAAEGKTHATIEAYYHAVTLLSDWLGTLGIMVTLETATKTHVAAWLADGSATWSQSTLATYMRRTRTFYTWLIRNEMYEGGTAHPLATVKAVREHEKVTDIPAPEEIAALIAACEITAEDRAHSWRLIAKRRDMAMLRIMLEPGTPRATELATLTLSQVDIAHDCILLNGKGGVQRVVPLGTKACKALALYLRVRSGHPQAACSDRLWLGARSGEMTRDGIHKIVKLMCRRANIRPIHPHAFRHLTADSWFHAGGTEREAMKLFGWRSDVMAKRYGAQAAARRAIEHARAYSIGDSF